MAPEETHVEILTAIPRPHYDRGIAAFHEMLDDLCGLSGQLAVRLSEFGIVRVEIEHRKGMRRNPQRLRRRFSPDTLQRCEVISFSAVVPCSDRIFDDPYIDPVQANKLLIGMEFRRRVLDILTISNLSHIGSVGLLDSIVAQDGRLSTTEDIPRMSAFNLQRAVDLAESINWPILKVIPFAQVWGWADRHIEMLDDFSSSSTGRALMAFSRLFALIPGDEAMQLLWALIGIEALYVRGKTAILEQVREKSQTLLGKQESHKKKICEMYDFRSRFIHGDMNYPGLGLHKDATPEFEKYTNDQMRAVDTAVAILAATLQEIIARDWTGLDFSYVVADAKTSS